VLASCVLQPLFGQLADLFGGRKPLITSTVLFALGSGIAGGAHNPGMLIAGRTIQGVGAGGVYVLLDIVCCDLVSLRDRGKYLGLMFSWSSVAAALGPVLGGVLAQN
jgi:MFS family permease